MSLIMHLPLNRPLLKRCLPRPTGAAAATQSDPMMSSNFRAVTIQMSTCGYYDSNPSKYRTAKPGYNCRVDISRGQWGFCPTTVLSASDCGLAGSCVDKGSCSNVCGFSGADVTIFSWQLTLFPGLFRGLIGSILILTALDIYSTQSGAPFCSPALLEVGVDQTFSCIACGNWSTTETLLAAPTTPSITTTSTTTVSISSKDSVNISKTASTPSRTVPPTPQIYTASSPPQQQPSTSIEPASSSSSPPNIGGITGGVLGGFVLKCSTVLGLVYCERVGSAVEAPTTRHPVLLSTLLSHQRITQHSIRLTRLRGQTLLHTRLFRWK